jgi:hypothetical protein
MVVGFNTENEIGHIGQINVHLQLVTKIDTEIVIIF